MLDQTLVPPHNIAMERSVIAAGLCDARSVTTARRYIEAADMYGERHRLIFAAMCRLVDDKQPTDIMSVANELERCGQLDAIAGPPAGQYADPGAVLMDLAELGLISPSIEHYAQEVARCAQARHAITAGQQLQHALLHGADAEQTLLEHITRCQSLVRRNQHGDGAITVERLLDQVVADLERLNEKKPGITTGYVDLDRAIGLIEKGWFFILTGRPMMGKTVAMLGMADHISSAHGPTLLVSAELSRKSVGRRFLAAAGRIPGKILRDGPFEQLDWQKIAAGRNYFHRRPLRILDKRVTFAKIVSEYQKMVSDYGEVAAILIDRLELIADVKQWRQRKSEYEVITLASNTLQEMAVELDVPIGCIVQMDRASEDRADKRPVMSDLRGSGHLEQDARLILGVYRPEYYDPTDQPGILHLITLKANESDVAKVTLNFQRDYPAIYNLARAA